MFDVDVYRPEEVELDEFANMQKESFKELLEKMGVSDAFITPEFYHWKYNGPFGSAKLVLAKDNGRIIASTVNHALKIQSAGREFRIWQNGDSAMLPQYRGKGLYHKCVKKAVESLAEDELIFGFPNINSVRGFSAHVPIDKGVIPLLAAPSIHPLWASGKHIIQVHDFSKTALDSSAFAEGRAISLLKDNAYLTWRYDKHPVNRYVSYFYHNSITGEQAVVVTRKADIGKRKVLVIMELFGTSLKSMSGLLHFAIKKQRTGLATLMFNSSFQTIETLRLGFIKVPTSLIPKKQALFVYANGDAARALLDKPWRIQMGDWDGF